MRWVTSHTGGRPADLKREAAARVDLNKAGRSELMQLPGVGPSRADKILAYREANGGFRRVEELDRVDGIGPVTVERLRPHVSVGVYASPEGSEEEPIRLSRKPTTSAVKSPPKNAVQDAPIDINRATAAELDKLPGIGPTLARRIVEERERRPFAKVEDLRRVSGIGVKRLEQLRPYIIVGE